MYLLAPKIGTASSRRVIICTSPLTMKGNWTSVDFNSDSHIRDRISNDERFVVGEREGMPITQRLLIIVSFVLPALPATLNARMTTSTQRVQISGQPTIPNGVVVPPQGVIHPNAMYTDEARRRRIEGAVVI